MMWPELLVPLNFISNMRVAARAYAQRLDAPSFAQLMRLLILKPAIQVMPMLRARTAYSETTPATMMLGIGHLVESCCAQLALRRLVAANPSRSGARLLCHCLGGLRADIPAQPTLLIAT